MIEKHNGNKDSNNEEIQKALANTISNNNNNKIGIADLPQELMLKIFNYINPPYRNMRLVCKLWETYASYYVQKEERKLELAVNKDLNLQWNIVPRQRSDPFRMPYIHVRNYFKTNVYDRGVLYVFGVNYDSARGKHVKKLFRFDTEHNIWLKPVSLHDHNAPRDVSYMFKWLDNIACFGRSYTSGRIWRALTRDLFLFNINSNKWSKIVCSNSPGSIKGLGATLVGNRLVVYGGQRKKCSSEVWCLDLLKHNWYKMQIEGNKPKPRRCHLQFEIDDQHIVIIGGQGNNETYKDGWLLDVTKVPGVWKELQITNDICEIYDFHKTAVCKVGNKILLLGYMTIFSDFSNVLAANLTPTTLDIISDFEIIPQALHQLRPTLNNRPPGETVRSAMISMFVCDLNDVLDSSNPNIYWSYFKNLSLIPGAAPLHTASNMINAEGKIIVFGSHIEEGTNVKRVHILEPLAN